MLDQEQGPEGIAAARLREAAELVVAEDKCATSFLQRKLAIGYNAAARLVEQLEAAGIVSVANNVGKREVLVETVPDDLGQIGEQVARDLAAPLLSDTDAATVSAGTQMKETDADREVRDVAYRVTAAELRSFVERFERLQADVDEAKEGQREVMAEAKARGYDTRCLRKVIAERKRDKDDLAEEEAVLALYREALGM